MALSKEKDMIDRLMTWIDHFSIMKNRGLNSNTNLRPHTVHGHVNWICLWRIWTNQAKRIKQTWNKFNSSFFRCSKSRKDKPSSWSRGKPWCLVTSRTKKDVSMSSISTTKSPIQNRWLKRQKYRSKKSKIKLAKSTVPSKKDRESSMTKSESWTLLDNRRSTSISRFSCRPRKSLI